MNIRERLVDRSCATVPIDSLPSVRALSHTSVRRGDVLYVPGGGTVPYMSPAQVRDAIAPLSRTQVFLMHSYDAALFWNMHLHTGGASNFSARRGDTIRIVSDFLCHSRSDLLCDEAHCRSLAARLRSQRQRQLHAAAKNFARYQCQRMHAARNSK